ncbi:hypothetical protein ACVXG7_15190 [Enterobacter hormaechei]
MRPFSVISLLRDKGVDKRYFDELAHVLISISAIPLSRVIWTTLSGWQIP